MPPGLTRQTAHVEDRHEHGHHDGADDGAEEDHEERFHERGERGEKGFDLLVVAVRDGVQHVLDLAGLFARGDYAHHDDGHVGLAREGHVELVALLDLLAGVEDGLLEHVVAERAGDDLEGLEDRHARVRHLCEEAAEAADRALQVQLAEDGHLQLELVELIASLFRRDPPLEEEAEDDDSAEDVVPVGLDGLGEVDERLRERGKGLAEAREHLREDRHDELDERGGHEQRDRDDDGRIGHRALHLAPEARRRLHDGGESLQHARELARLFARDDHVDVHVLEELREGDESLRHRVAAFDRRADVGEHFLELGVRALFLERLDRRQNRHARADHGRDLARERNDFCLGDFLLALDLRCVCHRNSLFAARHLERRLDGRDAGADLAHAGLLQRDHAFLVRQLLEEGGVTAFFDEVADGGRDGEDLHHRAAPLVARAVALGAADRAEHLDALERRGVDLVGEKLVLVDSERLLAEGAEAAEETLGLGQDQRARQHEGLDAHVEESRDDAARVVRVQRREHQVARQGGLHRDVRRLAVTDFADEHDVRVLTQDGAEDAREGEALGDVDVALVDALEFVFDRVLGRDDVDVRLVEVLQAGIKGRRLARARRARDEDDAVRLVDGELHRLVGVVVEAELGEAGGEVRLVEDTHDDLLAVDGRQDRHAHVDLLLEGLDLEAAVLRTPPFGDVEVGKDLDARADGVVERLRRGGALDELAVDAVAEARILLHRLEMDVGRLRLQRLDHDRVDHADDRRLACGVHGRIERRVGRLDLARGHLDLAVVAIHDVFHRKGRVLGVLRLLQALDGVRQLVRRDDDGPDLALAPARDLLLRGQVEGVGEGDGEPPMDLHERDRLDAAPRLGLHVAEDVLRRQERRRDGEGLDVEIVRRGDREIAGVGDLPDFLDADAPGAEPVFCRKKGHRIGISTPRAMSMAFFVLLFP